MSRIGAVASILGSVALGAACQSDPRATPSAEPSAASPPGTAAAPPEVNGTNTSNAETDPLEDEIRRLADRELAALPVATGATGTGFTVSVTGSKVTTEIDDNGALFKMDIGTDAPVACVVYAEPNDAGGTLRALVKSVGTRASAARIIPGVLLAEGERPVQRLDVLYKKRDVPEDGGPATGVLKLAWIGDFHHPALCYQDELGYSRTFTDVARRIANSLATAGAARPRQVEILRTAFGEVPVGFDYSGVWDEPDGLTRRRTTYSLSMVPMGPNLEVRDTISTVSLDAAGRIHGGRWTVSTNGDMSQNLTLEKQKAPLGFRVSGSTEGQPVDARISGFPEGLPDGRIDAPLAERIALRTPFEAVRRVYSPLSSPAEVLDERVNHGSTAGEVELQQGAAKTRILLDESGHLSRVEVSQGAASMVSQVLFARDGEARRTPVSRN